LLKNEIVVSSEKEKKLMLIISLVFEFTKNKKMILVNTNIEC